MASVATFWTAGNGTSEEQDHPKQVQQDHHLLDEPNQSVASGPKTTTMTKTTTTITPFQVAHRSRPRQITPPGASDSPSPFMSSTGEAPSNPFGEGTKGTFAASLVANSPLLKSPDGHSKRKTTEQQTSFVLHGVTTVARGVPSLSFRTNDSPESWDGSAWAFPTSPLKKKKSKRTTESSSIVVADGGFASTAASAALPPPSHYSNARILDVHADQQVHRRDMLSPTTMDVNQKVSVPEKASIQYDMWERINLATAGEENVLPFVRKQERPPHMQRQYLLQLPHPNPPLKPEVATPLPPPSSISTSPHVLYGWLHMRFAAGLVRSSFTMVHQMIQNDYDQARLLLEKIHQNPDRSQDYISELLTLRDHLAGLWCVYAHFAMDVGRLARTIRDDAPFPTIRDGGGGSNNEEALVAVVKEGSSTYGGTLRLQMINSPVRPSRKRRKSIKAAESEEIESQLEEEDEPNEVEEDEYVPAPPAATTTTTTTTAVNTRRIKAKKRPASGRGSGSDRKKRPSPKADSKGKKETTKVKTGHWTKAEHERFLEGIEIYGRGKWKLIAEVVKTRTTVQVKTHGQSVFALKENGGHHIQTLDKTPEQKKTVQRTMRTKKSTKADPENAVKDSNSDNSRRTGLSAKRGTVLSYDDDHEDQEEEEEEDVDMKPAFVQHPAVATSVVHGTPQATGPSHMTPPFMGTTSMANLEDLILGGGLFSPSEFSQIDKLPTKATGETSEPDAPIAVTQDGSWQSTDFVAAPQIPSNGEISVADAPMPSPCPPNIFDGFLDQMPPYMQGFFISVGILSTEQFLETPTQTLAEIYMCYQRDQAKAVMSSVVTLDVHSGTKTIAANGDATIPTDGSYHDIVGHALSVLLAARKCPLVGNHHFIVLAMGRMIVSAAPMEKTPNGASNVDVPTAVLSTRINSAIAANWDAMKSCHGSAVDESGVFSQNRDSAERATALLASLDFCGKKLVSEDQVQSKALREEMESITLLPQKLRKNASRPVGFVFNDSHATLALCWELNRWSRLEEQLRTNTSGKAMRLGESPWCKPTYQIEDLPMFANVDIITDAYHNRTYAEGNKGSETVVWEW